jgi:hypothetical protein
MILIPIPLPPSDLRLEGFSSLFFQVLSVISECIVVQ